MNLTKFGRVVVLSYNGDATGSLNEDDLGVVGTLPEEFIPRSTYIFCNIPIDDVRIQLRFTSNGEIIAHNYKESISAINTCRYNGVYVTKN